MTSRRSQATCVCVRQVKIAVLVEIFQVNILNSCSQKTSNHHSKSCHLNSHTTLSFKQKGLCSFVCLKQIKDKHCGSVIPQWFASMFFYASRKSYLVDWARGMLWSTPKSVSSCDLWLSVSGATRVPECDAAQSFVGLNRRHFSLQRVSVHPNQTASWTLN